jgi:hypothetical protein
MKIITAITAALILSGCATTELRCYSPLVNCSEEEYARCIAAAEKQSTPEIVSTEKLRCDVQRADRNAQEAADAEAYERIRRASTPQ